MSFKKSRRLSEVEQISDDHLESVKDAYPMSAEGDGHLSNGTRL